MNDYITDAYNTLIHEISHQIGAPDHYHEEVNGSCINTPLCSVCKEEGYRDEECFMCCNYDYGDWCADCKEDINTHMQFWAANFRLD